MSSKLDHVSLTACHCRQPGIQKVWQGFETRQDTKIKIIDYYGLENQQGHAEYLTPQPSVSYIP